MTFSHVMRVILRLRVSPVPVHIASQLLIQVTGFQSNWVEIPEYNLMTHNDCISCSTLFKNEGVAIQSKVVAAISKQNSKYLINVIIIFDI